MSDCPDKFRHGNRSYCATCFPGTPRKPEPPRETFDPESVRALLDLCDQLVAIGAVDDAVQRVRDSEHK